jgi:benzoyl-CoA reductase/2-hydroxyglutaryl-CoA dehydratase subunit BcrC/BadD/HgdB
MTPRRVIPGARPAEADGIIHPNSCHYIKSLLAEGMSGGFPGEIFIIANSCDGMRRLHDLWTEYVPAVPALFVDVPKKKDHASTDYFSSAIKALAGELECRFHCPPLTDSRLNEAIAACNQIRTLMQAAQRLQAQPDSVMDALSIFELYLDSARLHPAKFRQKLDFLLRTGEQKKSIDGRSTVILAGNVIFQPGLIELIRNAGGRIAAIDTCLGARHFDSLVQENTPDPLRALAERYLTRASCPRMEGISERASRLREMACKTRSGGIIYSSVKFCDSHLYDVPFLQERFREEGIPFLFLENDYEWSGLGQMKVRVEAFLALIREKEGSSHV